MPWISRYALRSAKEMRRQPSTFSLRVTCMVTPGFVFIHIYKVGLRYKIELGTVLSYEPC